MTHQNDSDLLNSILQQLNDSGLEALLGGFATLLNEAMLRQRSEALGAQPYERTDSRIGHANGFKPKTVDTRMGPLELAVPQVRGVNAVPIVRHRADEKCGVYNAKNRPQRVQLILKNYGLSRSGAPS